MKVELDELHVRLSALDSFLKSTPNTIELLFERAELNRRLAVSLDNSEFAHRALLDNDRAIWIEPNDPNVWLKRG